MLPLVIVLAGILAVGVLVLGYVAFPHRGRTVPGTARATAKAQQVKTRLVLPESSATRGVLIDPERDRRARESFQRAEERVLAFVGRASRRA